ncbi:MAG: NAD+ synthase [Candidatus Lokiarchaeota archaeon]|nr:NAD+ synthase [Candidatus Lokiarchaeota archaeon]
MDYNKLSDHLVKWIKDYIEEARAEGVVVGLSGGIDSATTAALCTKAIGRDRVFSFNLPCESIEKDYEDANMIAEHLGIEFHRFDLTNVYQEFFRTIVPPFGTTTMARANVKPRLRMLTSYFFAQSLGNYLVAGTGNRTELAIGYFTKYGDGGVDFEPIGNLYKCEVREVARILSIPEEIINKAPSAGLWEGQTDEGEIGITYGVLDEIIYRKDNNLDMSDLNKEDVEKVNKMMKLASHKLKMPPHFQIL